MPDITPVVRPPNPVDLIRESVNAAAQLGITVSTIPDLGVHCTSQHPPCWEREGRADCVSPLGAVLIARQPPIPSADDALAHVLGVSVLWVIGFDDGCAKQAPSTAFANGPARLLYAQGFEAGTTFRAVMHRRAGVPVERPDDAPTRPLVIDTPRSVLAELLAAHTPAQVLTLAADDFAARAGRLSADDAQLLAVVEFTLREMAADVQDVE